MQIPLKRTIRNFILVGILNIILISGVIVIMDVQFKASTVELRKNELRRLVQLGLNSIEPIRRGYREGTYSREEALELIASQVRLLTFDDETQPNYLFMSTYDGIMLVQPFEPELEGSNQLNLRDADGNFIIRELIKQAKSEPGWVSYRYHPPGVAEAQEKLSYITGLQEFDCYIGTGIYSGDIQTATRNYFLTLSIIFSITVIILIGLAALITYPIVASVRTITASMTELDESPLLQAPVSKPIKFKKNSDAYYLVSGFNDIVRRLAARNREIIAASEERDSLREEHIRIIEESLSEKEMMLKEINHRVKNNFQIIISLLKLELSENQDPVTRESFLELISRLESISIIHNMLYSNENYSSVSAETYLKNLAEYIIHSFGADQKIDIMYSIDSMEFSIDQAVTIGMITNETLTNSVKYAFKENESGIVSIGLHNKAGSLIFTITDNGSGLPDEYIQGKQGSLGINLIRNLSRQLDGTMTIDNSDGTRYRIEFTEKST
ncbi:MAG: cache domain-containing protein [Spirochaetales bacterium]|uniref:histidine kinase n=1 Tax=Candidatus Thalassospirochaeta sargassi TaxID=3119039 RepID=A0AAJ1IBL4_9SPIO|nr:cache domain-containing protein [Spirochaetales bacterium]